MPTAPGITMSLSGVDELLAAFAELGQVGSRAAMQDALKKGAEVTAEAARRMAPLGMNAVGEGGAPKKALSNSIAVRSRLSRSQERKRGGRRAEAEMFVGSTAPHAHLVEFGHLLVKARHEGAKALRGRKGKKKLVAVKTKRVIGHVPAYPFLRPAFDSTRNEATRVIFRSFGDSVTKVAKRYRRQAERGKLSRGARQAFRMELGL